MTMEAFYAGVYWGPREESIEECAERCTKWFEAIAGVAPSFSKWFETGWSRKEALAHEVKPTRETIVAILDQGRSYTDIDRKVIPDLGFSLWMWTGGKDGESSGISIDCGSFSQYVGNNCVVRLPDTGEVALRILQERVLQELLSTMVECWEPEHGVVTSHQCRDILNSPDDAVEIGWLTYLSSSCGEVPKLLPPAYSEPMGDNGTLIVATDERFSSANMEHIESIHRVESALGHRDRI